MKGYPVTESDMRELATVGIVATVCFSLAGIAFGLAIDIHKDLMLATPDVSESAMGFWSGLRLVCFIGTGLLVLLGAGLAWRGHSRIGEIKRQTTFNE